MTSRLERFTEHGSKMTGVASAETLAVSSNEKHTTWHSLQLGLQEARVQHRKGQLLPWLQTHLVPQWPFSRCTRRADGGHRHIPIRAQYEPALIDERSGRPYISNDIRTSRYTIYDFIPKQIVFQATRLSNFYFIVIGIPQAIPGFSTTGNFTTILPLLFFMLLTILKEGYDDLRRHRLDEKENRTLATRYRSRRACQRPCTSRGRYQEKSSTDASLWGSIQWRHLSVGDIVKVQRDEDFPADVVLLQTDTSDHTAYIETMALDGETNLKPRQAPVVLHDYDNLNDLFAKSCTVTAEQPNRDLYNFDGKITLHGKDSPLTSQEVIYRGSTLRNSRYAIGLIINTGEECKSRMNANHHPQAKKPRLERYANQIVLTLIVYVILLSMGCSVGYLLFQRTTERQSFYLQDADVPFKQIIIGFGIMFNNVIPLALYVSLEIVKIGQMILVSSDLEMYDTQNDEPMRCNTNTILENLGQVGFVLSDKTGTLTQNVMRFKGISVGGYAWSHSGTSSTADTAFDGQQDAATKKDASIGVRRVETVQSFEEVPDDCFAAFKRRSELYGSTKDLLDRMQVQPSSEFSTHAHNFMLAMAVCNTCLPESSDSPRIGYQAASPDELALADAAQDLGFTLRKRGTKSLLVRLSSEQHSGTDLEYEILNIIEFSSKRKRMSVVLRCPDDRIWLICKGADNVMIPRLQHAKLAGEKAREVKSNSDWERQRKRKSMQAPWDRPSVTIERIRHSLDPGVASPHSVRSPVPHYLSTALQALDDADVYSHCFQHIENFAVDGLRTLLYAHKYLAAAEYDAWQKRYRDASTSLKDRQSHIETVAEELEQSMSLLGATAIEDKLQTGVPETIEKLRRARIRVWMLTGDKRETAINIAHSARICRPESDVLILDAAKGDLEAQLQNVVQEVLVQRNDSVVVIDGHTLSVIEASKDLIKLFFSITPEIGSVICCRASPAQKAFIVEAIQECVPKALTLAIGDGANDIAMIQTAHVGVGISGKEGLQAARVADYSIAQFSFLQRLLLVHGRWNYVRTAKFVLWTFWKEMFFYMMQALYQQYTGYSGSSLYENWSLTALNTLFTSLCVILPGILEQDLRAETLLTIPELYIYGQTNQGLNLIGYLMWMGGAAIEGLIVWYLPWHMYGNGSVTSDNGAFALGDLMFSLAIVWTNWKLLLIETHSKTKIVVYGFVITVAGWWIWNVFLAGVYTSNLSPFDVKNGLFQTFGKDPNWWLTFLVTLVVLALLDLSVKAMRRLLIVNGYWPLWKRRTETRAQQRELEAWQELEQQPGIIERLGERAY
ncbi:hypothetical protein AMS68_000988 [Peltaster fructicola]|uniref:Phospholipid-transporting ATPase n=1 Tax=Peltaster fructicola TaxID=286661 RepID=A0A6H0XLF6_9PEZI|nr:hypothetical protein AMS68_000988 [Peltaster fructicola]